MLDKDYPSLFIASDRVSLGAQRAHISLTAVQLVLLWASGVSAFLSEVVSNVSIFRIATLVALVLATVFHWLVKARGYETTWYNARTVAESVKSLAWKYMMAVPPYDCHLSTEEADEAFLQHIRDIRDRRPSVVADGSKGETRNITGRMREVRGTSLSERTKFYIEHRLEQQLDWYAARAASNARKHSQWFRTTLFLQLAALGISVPWASNPRLPLDVVSILVAASTATIAWSQIRSFRELADAYALAKDELVALRDLATHIRNELSFREFVGQVETAISREHTMWLARRNSTLGA